MSKLRQLIRESINEYIREIDAAGTKAGLGAKIEATESAISKREKMAAMEGIDEAYHEMLDKGKMKEIGGEVKALKKSLEKLKKQLDKLNSKGGNKSEESEVEEKEIVDEVAIDENEGMEYEEMGMKDEGVSESLTPEEEEELDMIEDEMRYAVNSDSAGNPKMKERYDYLKSKRDEMDETMNESFLHMQKLAGILSETEYKVKVQEAARKKASAGMTKKEKSSVVKKVRAGKDIGKKGKGFEDVAKSAGGGKKGEKIAAATMWKGEAKKAKGLKEQVLALFEGEYSDWWAKADDELGLDFGDDIYSYVDSYDEPWQGKFANEVVNIDADNYEDFKNQVKQLYDEINPF